jgi:hypothetical protein
MQIAHELPPIAPPSDFLAPPPATRGHEASFYNSLVARLSAEVQPSDIPEQIWLREVADSIWEVGRLRRLKVSVEAGAAEEGLRLILVGLGVDDARSLAARWAAHDADAVAAVDATLAKAELDTKHIMAQALSLRLAQIERLHRLEGDALASRSQALREIARHRAQFAEALRRAALAADEAATGGAGQAASQPEAGQ